MIEPPTTSRFPISVRLLAAFCAICLLASCAKSRDREILLITKGMTFTLPANPTVANPVIPMHTGERVRLVLHNDAAGLIHNFEVPSWGVKTANVRSGETTEIEFTVPASPGQVEYICGPHSELMKGVVEVTSP
jgi:plastocyanin